MRRDNKHIYDTSEVLAKMATQGAFTMNSTVLVPLLYRAETWSDKNKNSWSYSSII